jgi:hypothetical protein
MQPICDMILAKTRTFSVGREVGTVFPVSKSIAHPDIYKGVKQPQSEAFRLPSYATLWLRKHRHAFTFVSTQIMFKLLPVLVTGHLATGKVENEVSVDSALATGSLEHSANLAIHRVFLCCVRVAQ